jgi:hypothetical protein
MLVQLTMVLAPILLSTFSEFVKLRPKNWADHEVVQFENSSQRGREITPRFSGAIAASMRRVSVRFQFRPKICPRLKSLLPWIRRLGARSATLIGGISHGNLISTV